jgi:hypothetical protein
MMNNHDDISVTYDLVHFLRFSYNKYNPIDRESSVYSLVKDIADRIYDRYQILLDVNKVINDINGVYDYAVIYNSIMSDLLLKEGDKNIWGEKTNVAWRNIPDFFDMYPTGRVINIIRDPRAVLSSWKQFTNAPGNDYLDSVLNSYDAMSTAIQYNTDYKDKRYVTVTYEDLINDLNTTMNKICIKLDISFSEKMLDQKNFKDKHGKEWKSNSVEGAAPAGIYVDAINKWKDNLESWEIAMCENILGDLFGHFNYATSIDQVGQNITNKMILEINKSRLTSDGLIRFMLTGESLERYPSDPTKKDNW